MANQSIYENKSLVNINFYENDNSQHNFENPNSFKEVTKKWSSIDVLNKAYHQGIKFVETYDISSQKWIGRRDTISLRDVIHKIIKAACKDDSDITNQDLMNFLEH